MDSIWTETARLPTFPALAGDCSTDVLIIGGGTAGLLCARLLEDSGIDYILVEADTIASGITKNTTAKITSQHGLIYRKLVRKFGVEGARLYLEANQQALAQFHRRCQVIDCDYFIQNAYVYSVTDRKILDDEMMALEELGFPAYFAENLPLPIPTVGGIVFPNQAQFHPLKFLSAIAKDLKIHEKTKILELAPHKATFHGGTIRAEKIIVATHFPMLNKHGFYFLKLYQHRSYCLALENAPLVKGMYVDQQKNGLSFRNQGDLLILGGGSHRTGKIGGSWVELEQFAHRHYPQAQIKYRWATQDCMTLDDVPYVGQYSASTPDLYVATGFNKWGMTGSMAAAQLLTELVQGKSSPYAALFSPSRSILRPQLAVNAFEALTNLLRLTPKRCPHMGCALSWNPQEHSWDCPCHGSRFAENGNLIDGPSTSDLKK